MQFDLTLSFPQAVIEQIAAEIIRQTSKGADTVAKAELALHKIWTREMLMDNLGIKTDTAIKFQKLGLKYSQIGSKIFYKEEDVVKFLEEHQKNKQLQILKRRRAS